MTATWHTSLLWLVACLILAPALRAQPRPYIGFVYPPGGQQGTSVQIRLGGQNLDGVHAATLTGPGVTARVVEFHRRLNNQEIQLLRDQLKELKRAPQTAAVRAESGPSTSAAPSMMAPIDPDPDPDAPGRAQEGAASDLIARIEKRTREFVQTPACAAIATVTTIEVAIAPDAEPGEREIRLVTPRGASNPLPFHVGQLPEYIRTPMPTTPRQVLGKEAQALRKRPAGEVEERIVVPCIVNGQIAAGEINRYRFEARQGQRLVISTLGRQLIPFIADAVPGWFQPVIVLYDATGKEVAYADDDRFNPDPTILCEAPKDGEYVLAVHDGIYRGREDFVYRITIGEVPFLTSVFPLGARAGEPAEIRMAGWNLDDTRLSRPATDAAPGIEWLTATRGGLRSNRMPFARDTLPETFEQPSDNDTPDQAQKVTLPIIVNGRIERPGDLDVFAFVADSNETIVAEVQARRLDSPLDSMIKLTDADGTVLAFNDDFEDLTFGAKTHHADSRLMVTVPSDGRYFLHLGDTARQGGDDYGYRLRLSQPQPDFALRVVPSSIGLRSKSTAALTVHARRTDGFGGPIRLALDNPPDGFSSQPVTLSSTQTVARLTVRSSGGPTGMPVDLSVVGKAKIGGREVTRRAVPAEDMMQAFLWRHLVPASDLKAVVSVPAAATRPDRLVQTRPQPSKTTNALDVAMTNAATNALAAINPVGATNAPVAAAGATPAAPKFTRQQIAGRLRQLRMLREERLLTDQFYQAKVAECEVAQ
ncbi:MAG TPA: PPC domain-containing protein [Verrucomicrobiota bacterium]|nr:PPC domain-containing protein [Verrucomicrobiota bacterium]